ncbi:unnamed protein product, partial [Ectocarpus sp. 13 AM-2016]
PPVPHSFTHHCSFVPSSPSVLLVFPTPVSDVSCAPSSSTAPPVSSPSFCPSPFTLNSSFTCLTAQHRRATFHGMLVFASYTGKYPHTVGISMMSSAATGNGKCQSCIREMGMLLKLANGNKNETTCAPGRNSNARSPKWYHIFLGGFNLGKGRARTRSTMWKRQGCFAHVFGL